MRVRYIQQCHTLTTDKKLSIHVLRKFHNHRVKDDENEVSSRTNNDDDNVYDKENYEDDVNVEMT